MVVGIIPFITVHNKASCPLNESCGVRTPKETISLNKLELIQKLKNKTRLTKDESAEIVNIFFEAMTEAMVKGERIEIRGLWSFYIKNYKPYTGRNPRTGEAVPIAAKKLPFFKPGKELKERVDY